MVTVNKMYKPAKKIVGHSHDTHGPKPLHQMHGASRKPHSSSRAPMRKTTMNVSRGK